MHHIPNLSWSVFYFLSSTRANHGLILCEHFLLPATVDYLVLNKCSTVALPGILHINGIMQYTGLFVSLLRLSGLAY